MAFALQVHSFAITLVNARSILTNFVRQTRITHTHKTHYSPNSTWLVTSHLDRTRHVRRVERVETRVSSRAVQRDENLGLYPIKQTQDRSYYLSDKTIKKFSIEYSTVITDSTSCFKSFYRFWHFGIRAQWVRTVRLQVILPIFLLFLYFFEVVFLDTLEQYSYTKCSYTLTVCDKEHQLMCTGNKSVGFNVPPKTIYVILGTILTGYIVNQQCQSSVVQNGSVAKKFNDETEKQNRAV